jgi:hypothetical protein
MTAPTPTPAELATLTPQEREALELAEKAALPWRDNWHDCSTEDGDDEIIVTRNPVPGATRRVLGLAQSDDGPHALCRCVDAAYIVVAANLLPDTLRELAAAKAALAAMRDELADATARLQFYNSTLVTVGPLSNAWAVQDSDTPVMLPEPHRLSALIDTNTKLVEAIAVAEGALKRIRESNLAGDVVFGLAKGALNTIAALKERP